MTFFYEMLHGYKFDRDEVRVVVADLNKRYNIDKYESVENCINGIHSVYKRLLKKTPVLQPYKYILIEHKKEKLGRYVSKYLDVDVLTGGHRFGLDFTHWNEVIGMVVPAQTKKKFSNVEILVYVIWEMTVYGWTEKRMNKKRKELLDLAKNVDRSKYISWDDLKKKLRQI